MGTDFNDFYSFVYSDMIKIFCRCEDLNMDEEKLLTEIQIFKKKKIKKLRQLLTKYGYVFWRD